MDSNPFEGSSPSSWADGRPLSSSELRLRMAPRKPYPCDICGIKFTRKQDLSRHLRVRHFPANSCLYCDFKWSLLYKYRTHLRKHYPAVDPVVVGRATSILLCMYCNVEWDQPSQYKDHLREHHPNVDPDAVLGYAPGSQRRDKIIVIARHKLRFLG